MHTIAICDMEPVAMEGVRSLTESTREFRVVSTDTCLADGAISVRELLPSIALVNNAFGPNALLRWIHEIRSMRSRTAIVVWGSLVQDSEVRRYLQAGAAAVVRRTASLASLLRCFRAVASEEAWIEDGVIVKGVVPKSSRSGPGSTAKRARPPRERRNKAANKSAAPQSPRIPAIVPERDVLPLM